MGTVGAEAQTVETLVECVERELGAPPQPLGAGEADPHRQAAQREIEFVLQQRRGRRRRAGERPAPVDDHDIESILRQPSSAINAPLMPAPMTTTSQARSRRRGRAVVREPECPARQCVLSAGFDDASHSPAPNAVGAQIVATGFPAVRWPASPIHQTGAAMPTPKEIEKRSSGRR